MDAGLVGERVAADNRLVRLDGFVGDAGEELAGLEESLGYDTGVVRIPVVPHPERHDDLFERRIAGTFPDAVDGALDLPYTALNGCEAVGDRQPEIVVAMGAEDRFVGVGHPAANLFEELAEIFGRRV